jgi:acyl-CoA thioester hydrolase
VRHEVTYASSLAFSFEPVSIECWVTEIRAASFTMGYEIFTEAEDGGRTVHLRARTVLTPYVFATERPRRLHPEEREALTRLLEPEEPVRAPRPPEVVEVPGGHYPVHVRFSDVDVYGHVNNVKYFEYFQEARIQLTVAQGGDLGDGYHLVVAQTDVDYRRPILFRAEPYDCRTWVSRIGTSSLVFESVVSDGDEVLARARVVGVCMDSATGRPTPVPDRYRHLVDA